VTNTSIALLNATGVGIQGVFIKLEGAWGNATGFKFVCSTEAEHTETAPTADFSLPRRDTNSVIKQPLGCHEKVLAK
jgi:hypothetical protein